MDYLNAEPMEDESWELKLGNLMKEAYAKNGYENITIIVGATKGDGDELHTMCWTPGDTFNDNTDFRFILFAMFNHIFAKFNKDYTE